MADELIGVVVTFFHENTYVQLGLGVVLAALLGWIMRGSANKSRIQKLDAELEIAQKKAAELSKQTENLSKEQAQTLDDAASLRAEALSENETLKGELVAAQTALETSRTEIAVLANTMPAVEVSGQNDIALRDALAVAEADISQLSKELQVKSEQFEKMQTKADIALANAIDIDLQPEDTGETGMANWRARFLESRLRLLEAQLKNSNQAPAPIPQEDTATPTEPTAANTSNKSQRPDTKPKDAHQTNEMSKEEELANLRWRVRYLETRLAGSHSNATETLKEPALIPQDTTTHTEQSPEPRLGLVSSNMQSPLGRLAEAANRAKASFDPQTAGVPDLIPQQPMPLTLSSDLGGDNVSRICGIGPLTAKALSAHGITTVQQLANLTPENGVWLEQHIGLGGRLFKENWIEKAQAFLTQTQK